MPVGNQMFVGMVAIRAYIDASLGRLDEAVDLLLQAFKAQPQTPYVAWLERWRELPGFAQALVPGRVLSTTAETVSRSPEYAADRKRDRTALANVARLLDVATDASPDQDFLWFLRCVALRKLGRFDEAARVGNEAMRRRPSFHVEVALGGLYKEQGRYAEAVDHYKGALRYEATTQGATPTVRNDIADNLVRLGQLDEALGWYREMLRFDPQDPWALPSSLYFMEILEPGTGNDARLQEYARQHPDNDRATDLVGRLEDRATRYLTRLPQASEATVNIGRHLLAKAADMDTRKGSKVSLSVSHLESPSARLAIELQMAMIAPQLLVEFGVAAVPTPDTRQPLRPVDFVLWRYEGMTPSPNVAPPPAPVAEAVAAIAREPYHIEAWRTRAGALAGQLGPGALPALLGVLVHPPMPPQSVPMWDWMRQVQMAGVLTIAQLDAGWDGSVRRKALLSLAYGPMDWTGEMAVVVLTDLARREPVIAPEVAGIFDDLFQLRPNEGAWVLREPLLYGLLRLPQVDAETRRQAALALAD